MRTLSLISVFQVVPLMQTRERRHASCLYNVIHLSEFKTLLQNEKFFSELAFDLFCYKAQTLKKNILHKVNNLDC